MSDTTGTPTGGAAGDQPATPDFETWIADSVNAEFTKKIRNEAAANRIKASHAEREVTKRFAEAVGVEYDPAAPPSIEDLLGKWGKAPEELKAARIEARNLNLALGLEKAFN